MGIVAFLLPDDLNASFTADLEQAYLTGGPDNVPWPCIAHRSGNRLTLQRETDESGYASIPWQVGSQGVFRCGSCTVMERPQPFILPLELARGKIHQVRSQAFDWQSGGLKLSNQVRESLSDATLLLCRGIQAENVRQQMELSQQALEQGHKAARLLIDSYLEQVFEVRHEKDSLLPSLFGMRLSELPAAESLPTLEAASNSLCLQLDWPTIEPTEGSRNWDAPDKVMDWAEQRGIHVTGGPFLDWYSNPLPPWVQALKGDLNATARAMAHYVAAVIRRYRTRTRRWFLSTGSNLPSNLGWTEEEMLWLTVRLAQCVRQLDPEGELLIGVAEPWGECMAKKARNQSPFIIADTLIRSDLNLSGLFIDLLMGVPGVGSYVRDPLDCSRLLDMYALLGVPVLVTLGYPSPPVPIMGCWGIPNQESQAASWATCMGSLALCKPYVQGVYWHCPSRGQSSILQSCSPWGHEGEDGSVAAGLRNLRREHLH